MVQTNVTSPICTIFSCDIAWKIRYHFSCMSHENMVSYIRIVLMSRMFPCWTRITIHLAEHAPQENNGMQVRTRTWNRKPQEFSNQTQDKTMNPENSLTKQRTNENAPIVVPPHGTYVHVDGHKKRLMWINDWRWCRKTEAKSNNQPIKTTGSGWVEKMFHQLESRYRNIQ